MWVRSAFWIGSAKPGADDGFRDGINRQLIPALRVLPGVRGARALWPRRREDDPPEIACQVLVEFDRREDLELMLGSPERRAVRVQVVEVAGLFVGTISHIDYETA